MRAAPIIALGTSDRTDLGLLGAYGAQLLSSIEFLQTYKSLLGGGQPLVVEPIRQIRTRMRAAAPFQVAVRELTANEIVFGVVGPVGSGTSEIAEALETLMGKAGYDTSILKARDVIAEAAARSAVPIPTEPGLEQTKALQDAGDRIREGTGDNAAVAVGLIKEVRSRRAARQRATPISGESSLPSEGEIVEPDGTKRAYILDSLRHPHEIALLRRVYQEAFCLIGVFCHEEERLRRLRDEKYRKSSSDEIRLFMDRDENAPEAHGQKVADTFHLSDYFVDNTLPRFKQVAGKLEENPEWDVPDQLGRLVDILTHRTIVRPFPAETGMFHAHGARMRSSCLSRQVGAALMDISGTLLATGTNEVPRAGGGVYGGDLEPAEDFRCFVHNKYCSNTREQNSIIKELFEKVEELGGIEITDKLVGKLRKTRIGQLIEFSRAVHAEMDALLSAARTGAGTSGTRLFVTTFPCHNCARHIVSAGVIEVQYIEPYLKSQAIPLHGDAIVTDPKKWIRPDGPRKASGSPNVLFRPFIGVAPRLYRRAFIKDRDLKDNQTGDMITEFGPSFGHATTDTLRVSYAQVEATLAAIKIEAAND